MDVRGDINGFCSVVASPCTNNGCCLHWQLTVVMVEAMLITCTGERMPVATSVDMIALTSASVYRRLTPILRHLLTPLRKRSACSRRTKELPRLTNQCTGHSHRRRSFPNTVSVVRNELPRKACGFCWINTGGLWSIVSFCSNCVAVLFGHVLLFAGEHFCPFCAVLSFTASNSHHVSFSQKRFLLVNLDRSSLLRLKPASGSWLHPHLSSLCH